MTTERTRLTEARDKTSPWKKWGPYLSERQWGTVREDYSTNEDAWNYFTHDQARSRAYRWGEDGLAGISDDKQILCFALALWNGKDPILKERLFGLSNGEGNHGEDVKEYYYYLDSTPTHSYMKYLYKYPQAAYPYEQLVSTNRGAGKQQPEFELIDTGIFDQDRYFDVFVEYAKASADDILVEITIHNRGPERATLHVLPTLWFRNTWSWGDRGPRPGLQQALLDGRGAAVSVVHPALGNKLFAADGATELLFTENETNSERLSGTPNRTPYVKDAFHDYLVRDLTDAVNPRKEGTKVAAHYTLTVEAGGSRTVRLRLSDASTNGANPVQNAASAVVGRDFDAVMQARRSEADEFYDTVIARHLSPDEKRVMRQALAGMLWSKQFYYYDVDLWVKEHGIRPMQRAQRSIRNDRWHHMYNADIISMPDKWEYPWYAAWDLAFHVLALTMVDTDFGKEQLDLIMRPSYQHPSGQVPAYEWNFGDVNPPVLAWSTLFTYRLEAGPSGKGDVDWLQRMYQKLLLNFNWWVNRKDRSGNNVFEGGFLGLDNIGVFDRSSALPTGGYLEQADGTAWMALYCQNMLEITNELDTEKSGYSDMLLKFVEHFLWIASSMVRPSEEVGMWDEADGFFYDVLRFPDGRAERLRVRSMVGLLPLCAVTVFDGVRLRNNPELRETFSRFLASRPELTVMIQDPQKPGYEGRYLGSILNEANLRRVLSIMLDENEFLSPYGIRALSRVHADHPYVFHFGNDRYTVSYVPGDSDSGLFGGNSNWRGPIWMPVNALIVRALLQYYLYYGDTFRVECPTGSGQMMTLYQVAAEISRRLSAIFLADRTGRRPVFGQVKKFQEDPAWKDYVPFYEYFHGDTGAGVGASHQTGWTGVVARLMQLFASTTAENTLELGKSVVGATTGPAAPARPA